MKVEAKLFIFLVPFFILAGTVYGFMTDWNEFVGSLGLLLVAGLSGMIGFYLSVTGRRVGLRPEDRVDAEIHEASGEQGMFSPWSWWPLILAVACAGGFLGLAIGWWILYMGAGLAFIGLVGWVYEYSRGDHAH